MYEEQNSGARDSVYVYEAFEGETDEGQRYFVVRMHSTYDEYNYYHEFWESAQLNPLIRPECELQQMNRTKTRPGDFVGTAVTFFYPCILNDFRFVGLEDELISIDSLSENNSQEIETVYFDIDICRSEHYEYVGFSYEPEKGITRKTFFERNEVWHLTSYHIVQ